MKARLWYKIWLFNSGYKNHVKVITSIGLSALIVNFLYNVYLLQYTNNWMELLFPVSISVVGIIICLQILASTKLSFRPLDLIEAYGDLEPLSEVMSILGEHYDIMYFFSRDIQSEWSGEKNLSTDDSTESEKELIEVLNKTNIIGELHKSMRYLSSTPIYATKEEVLEKLQKLRIVTRMINNKKIINRFSTLKEMSTHSKNINDASLDNVIKFLEPFEQLLHDINRLEDVEYYIEQAQKNGLEPNVREKESLSSFLSSDELIEGIIKIEEN